MSCSRSDEKGNSKSILIFLRGSTDNRSNLYDNTDSKSMDDFRDTFSVYRSIFNLLYDDKKVYQGG